MSGGEPSSIKRAQLCDTVSLFVRVSKCMTPLCGLSCFFMYRLPEGMKMTVQQMICIYSAQINAIAFEGVRVCIGYCTENIVRGSLQML